MSDLTATHCGCARSDSSCGCNSIIWIIILLFFCNGDNGCGFSRSGGCDNGCGCDSIIIILLLLCCCGGNSIC